MPTDGIAAVRSTSLPVFGCAPHRGPLKSQSSAVSLTFGHNARMPTALSLREASRLEFVRDLALEGMNLGDEDLVRVLQRHHGMTSLHLGLNGLTAEGMKDIGNILAKLRDLEYLDIWGNVKLGSAGTWLLLRPLSLRPCRLRTLNLSQCGLCLKALPSIIACASQGHLCALSIANNELGPRASRSLAALLRCGLLAVDLSDCALGLQGTAGLAKTLQDGQNECAFLGLSFNQLGEDGLEEILRGAAVQARCRGALEELCLRGNGHVGEVSAQAVQRFACGTSFRRLDLSRNSCSPQADVLMRHALPVNTRAQLELPDCKEESEGTYDDAVYWHRCATVLDRQQPPEEVSLRPGGPPPAPSANTQLAKFRFPALNGRLPEDGADQLALARGDDVPAPAMAGRIPQSVPVRIRRNESEAFEAFVVDRTRYGGFPSPVRPVPSGRSSRSLFTLTRGGAGPLKAAGDSAAIAATAARVRGIPVAGRRPGTR